jgi:major membrane immunogen (membrane-anchored lipoprotein)
MKTTNTFFYYLMVIAMTITLVSCGSKDFSEAKDPSLSNQQAGAIVDLGVINGDLHQMSVTLSNVIISINSFKVAAVKSSLVYIHLFTNSNGMINDGTYTYSNSDHYSPFTFKTGSVYFPNAEANSFDAFEMSDGSISVSREGTTYHISLNGTLADGNTVSGTFHGILSYSDTSINY